MNANELASEILYRFGGKDADFFHDPLMAKVYDFIRQQQAQLEILKNSTFSQQVLYTNITNEEYEAVEKLFEEYGNCRFDEGNLCINLSELSEDILIRFRAILRKAKE